MVNILAFAAYAECGISSGTKNHMLKDEDHCLSEDKADLIKRKAIKCWIIFF
jgi:hypothetical protein